MLNLAVVTTVADAANSIEKFIGYHLSLGFSRIYVFVDDNDVATLEKVSNFAEVVVFSRDSSLEKLWALNDSRMLPARRVLVNNEVMVRQELNFYVAFSEARNDGIDWVLHIDIDELFYPNGCDLNEHFKYLQINGFRSITYLNYESISLSARAQSIYESSEYFKVNYFKNKHWFYSKNQYEFIEKSGYLPRKFFKYYQNGKSCVSTFGEKLFFYDVHSIIGDGRRKMGGRESPIILHFPCSTFEEFDRKYHRLGNFSDEWMGVRRTGEYIDDVHLLARDFYANNADNQKELLDFYKKTYLLSSEQVSRMEKVGLAQKITYHKEVLGRLGGDD